jgi:RNA polymerase sigma-70 factor (ECF subfamily)
MDIDVQARARWLARHILPFEPVLRARLRRMTIHGIEVDDVIQEMYARIVSQPFLEAIKYPRQYAVQTATSIIIDHIRRSRVISISAAGSLDHLEILDPEASPEQQLEFREEIVEVARSLAEIPERTREVLILRRVEGLSQQETAERLGISVKTVDKHLARGVAALMASFGRGGKSAGRASSSVRTDDHEEKKPTSGD